MTLVRFGQAALIAAILTLANNAVWAQDPCPTKESGGIYNRLYDVLSSFPCEIKVKCCVCKDGCAADECCKDGKCCKDCGSCCSSKKCDAKCSCGKDGKCACCKDGECSCDKNGKCSCDKDKISTTKSDCPCPFMSKLAKRTAIIMVMPSSMPLPPCCMEAMGMIPHPPMPPGPQVFLPPMMPPMPPIPPTPSMGIGTPMMPPMPAICPPPAYAPVAAYAPCPEGNTVWAAGPPSVVSCSATSSSNAAKVCITATPSSDQLEMCIGEETCVRCKKMSIKIGDNEMMVSRFEDRVRIRGEELKSTADCVRTDGKDRLILEGDVVLHYKKEGRSAANVLKADRIELNLSSGAVTIKQGVKTPSSPAIHIDRDEGTYNK